MYGQVFKNCLACCNTTALDYGSTGKAICSHCGHRADLPLQACDCPQCREPDAKLLEKLLKLIEHERSARKIGSVAEAEAFASKIARMLADYELSMTEVELFAAKQANPVGETFFNPTEHGLPLKQARSYWTERLALIVAEAHFCRLLIVKGMHCCFFVGRDPHRSVACAMFAYLWQTAEALADEAVSAERRRVRQQYNERMIKVAAFRRSFINGFVYAIAERYKAMKQETVSDIRRDPRRSVGALPSATTALARISNLFAEADEYRRQRTEGKAVEPPKAKLGGVRHAADLGYQAGMRVDLNDKVINGASEPGALPPANNL